MNHATTCVSGPLLVIVGGRSGHSAISDCWIGDFTTNQWKKVLCLYLRQFRDWFDTVYILQLSLPDSVTERCYHSLSALQLSPHSLLLVIFGGQRSLGSHNLSHTALIELSEYYQMALSMQYSSYSDRYWAMVQVYC